MTKYRLKDAELQKKLDVISDGDFSRQIESRLQTIRGCGTIDADYRLFFGELPGRYELVNRFSMLLYEHEIEVFEEYDPNDWNTFPDTTPPEKIPMRVEFIWNDGTRGKCCGVYRNGVWSNSEDRDCEIENVKRFRPWE